MTSNLGSLSDQELRDLVRRHNGSEKAQAALDELNLRESKARPEPSRAPIFPSEIRVTVTDVDVSFKSMIWLTIKAIPAIAIGSAVFFFVLYFLIGLVAAGLLPDF